MKAATCLDDRYEVDRRLGSGAGGDVFRVHDRAAGGAPRALKRVGVADPTQRQRLAGEFRQLSQLRHPNLVRVFELATSTQGTAEIETGTLYFTAELVDGVPPGDAVRAAADPVVALLDIASDLAGALAHLHARGLVHCDVKPSNVLVRVGPQAVLLDLGLSALRASAAGARGTLRYMAPEALAGQLDPRGDLYGLGATLYEAATGAPHITGDDAPSIVRAVCAGTPRPATARAPWLPPPLASLIHKLIEPDLRARHSSAAAVVADLARVRERLGLPPRADDAAPAALLPPTLVGRAGPLAALADALRAVAHAPASAVTLAGPRGAGKRAVIDEALRRHQLDVAAGRAAAFAIVRGSLDALVQRAVAGDPWIDAALSALARRATEAPVVLVLDDRGDPRGAALARAVEAGDPAVAGARLLVIAAADREPDPASEALACPPLTAPDTAALAASMLGRPPEPAWAHDLWVASGGLPRLAVEIVRAAAASGIDDVEDHDPRALLADRGLDAVVVRRVQSLPTERAAILEALAVLGGEATAAQLAATLEIAPEDAYAAAGPLAASGLVRRDGERIQLPSDAHARALEAALPEARRRSLHRAALRVLGDAADPVARARHQVVVGPARAAAEACLAAADALAARGRGADAVEAARQAVEHARGPAAALAQAALAERATAVGRYDDAIAAAREASRSRDPALRRRALAALGRAEQKRGDASAAEATYRALLALAPDDEAVRGALARVLVSAGRFAEADALAGGPAAEAPLAGDAPAGRELRLEASGLARLYLGDPNAAEAAFVRLERLALARHDQALLARALGLRGMVAQLSGDVDLAASLYDDARARARAASDVHAAVVYAVNGGAALAWRGRFGDALRVYDQALPALARLGAVPEAGAVRFNRGFALLALGEVAAARRDAERALAEAARSGQPQTEIYALLLAGDVARREGLLARASEHYEHALAVAVERGQPRDRLLARAELAELAAELTDPGWREYLADAEADVRTDDDRDRLALAGARAALAAGADGAPWRDALDQARDRVHASGRSDQAWRADAVAARLALARGDRAEASRALTRARETLQAILDATPEAHRDGVRSDPEAIALAAARDASAEPRAVVPGGADQHLRRLLALSRRLNSEQRLEPLLEEVLDAVIELTAAERGFLLLMAPGGDDAARTGALRVEVARNFDQRDLVGDAALVSRSIAERAARTGEVVLTVDAAFDDRFGAVASVAALRLRSVLAVPLRQKGRAIGTVYLDHRFRRAAFSDDQVEAVLELADIAAIAIDNARLAEDNARRAAQIAALNRRLQDELDRQESELASVKARLPEPDARLRHSYPTIIGRSPPMVEMLALVDRAAETALPVVIFGESGTGKELVARALHTQGPRRDEAFVALNCGAVPQELLETELFGHARGSFTGADRDRRGLFEVADGGTLLLDEVADTSPAMQAKLLRALQEGEIRRVGDERPRKVDVRVIAASNRRLRDLVAEGRFREDLFYRLNVLEIHVPPLRDRIEDIPALAPALLARFTPRRDAPPTLTRDALARLCAYPWPGNVRELENELARAAALADGAIRARDLSPAIAAAPPRRPGGEAELRLKPRVEALKRALVEDAMERTGGNQTRAAKLLGLSRYGLQKKLARYGLSRES